MKHHKAVECRQLIFPIVINIVRVRVKKSTTVIDNETGPPLVQVQKVQLNLSIFREALVDPSISGKM